MTCSHSPRFPVKHWRRVWSTISMERINKEIKRHTHVVGVFLTSRR